MSHFQIIDGVLIKHEKEAGKLRMAGGSWSINLDELKDSPKMIEYKTETCTYRITYTDARNNGFTRVMAGERKLIVPIKCWTIERNSQ